MSADIRRCFDIARESQVFEPKDSFLCRVQLDPGHFLIGVIRTPPTPLAILEIPISEPSDTTVGIERMAARHNREVMQDLAMYPGDVFKHMFGEGAAAGVTLLIRDGKLVITKENNANAAVC